MIVRQRVLDVLRETVPTLPDDDGTNVLDCPVYSEPEIMIAHPAVLAAALAWRLEDAFGIKVSDELVECRPLTLSRLVEIVDGLLPYRGCEECDRPMAPSAKPQTCEPCFRRIFNG